MNLPWKTRYFLLYLLQICNRLHILGWLWRRFVWQKRYALFESLLAQFLPTLDSGLCISSLGRSLWRKRRWTSLLWLGTDRALLALLSSLVVGFSSHLEAAFASLLFLSSRSGGTNIFVDHHLWRFFPSDATGLLPALSLPCFSGYFTGLLFTIHFR